jgi:hypothetical protein
LIQHLLAGDQSFTALGEAKLQVCESAGQAQADGGRAQPLQAADLGFETTRDRVVCTTNIIAADPDALDKGLFRFEFEA